jgi:hypothetical protein
MVERLFQVQKVWWGFFLTRGVTLVAAFSVMVDFEKKYFKTLST